MFAAFGFFSRNHFLRGDFIFQWMGSSFSVGDSLLGGEGTPLALHLLWWGEERQKDLWSRRHTNHDSPHFGQTLLCVVTGLKRCMNFNTLWKIYKKMILTLQEKALLHRQIFKTFPRSVQHVYSMVDFKPL